MMKLTSTFMLSTLLLAGCASNYNNGVSTWTATHEQPELLETQEYEKYVVEEVETPEYRVVETEITEIGEQDLVAVSDTTPTVVLGSTQRPALRNVYVQSNTAYTQPVTVNVLDEVSTRSSATRSNYRVNIEDMDNDPSVPDSVVVSPYETIKRAPVTKAKVSKTTTTTTTTVRPVPATAVNVGTGKYSNNSKGPYLYKYNNPIETRTQVVTSRSSSTRPTSVYTKTKSYITTRGTDGGCYVNINGGEKPMLTKVLCSEQLTNDLVSKIQTALNTKGYNAGPVTGYMSTKTHDALYKFQQARNLPTGAVDIDTLNSLGINSYNF